MNSGRSRSAIPPRGGETDQAAQQPRGCPTLWLLPRSSLSHTHTKPHPTPAPAPHPAARTHPLSCGCPGTSTSVTAGVPRSSSAALRAGLPRMEPGLMDMTVSGAAARMTWCSSTVLPAPGGPTSATTSRWRCLDGRDGAPPTAPTAPPPPRRRHSTSRSPARNAAAATAAITRVIIPERAGDALVARARAGASVGAPQPPPPGAAAAAAAAAAPRAPRQRGREDVRRSAGHHGCGVVSLMGVCVLSLRAGWGLNLACRSVQ